MLAFHPVKKELRTANILTNYSDNYHVQYHNQDLGVYFQKEKSIVLISASNPVSNEEQDSNQDSVLHQGLRSASKNEIDHDTLSAANAIRNDLLSSQLLGNQNLMRKLNS